MGRGLHQAGFDVVAGVDHDEQALQTYNENLSGEPVLHDLADVDPDVLPVDSVDYIHASPPCQGFSQAKGHVDIDDERNELVWSVPEWADALQPKVVTLENVPGLPQNAPTLLDQLCGDGRPAATQQTLTGDDGVSRSATRGFGSIGYEARWSVLNSAAYGVPQSRERLFIVAVREDVETPQQWFPTPTHSAGNYPSVADAIEDLAPIAQTDGLTSQQNEAHQKAGRRPMHDVDEPARTIRCGTPPQLVADVGNVPNHVPQDHEPETRERFAQLAPGEHGNGISNRRLSPDDASPTLCAAEGAGVPPVHYIGPYNHEATDHSESHKDVIRSMEPGYTGSSVTRRRLHPDEPAGTVTVSSTTPAAHYEEVRRLTARECARIQSFPDTHVFTGGKTAQLKQIGNAVPPKLAYHLGRHVRTEVLA